MSIEISFEDCFTSVTRPTLDDILQIVHLALHADVPVLESLELLELLLQLQHIWLFLAPFATEQVELGLLHRQHVLLRVRALVLHHPLLGTRGEVVHGFVQVVGLQVEEGVARVNVDVSRRSQHRSLVLRAAVAWSRGLGLECPYVFGFQVFGLGGDGLEGGVQVLLVFEEFLELVLLVQDSMLNVLEQLEEFKIIHLLYESR